MKVPILQLMLLTAVVGSCHEFASAQAKWQGAELLNKMHARGYRQTDSTRFHTITFRQWEGNEQRSTTASMYLVGGMRIHLPDEDLLDELMQRGLREAQQWIDIDTRRWDLNKQQQKTLLLAAELQMRATMRKLHSDLHLLNDLDFESPDSVPELQKAEFAIIEALNPRFRARECLYYRMLVKMKR